MPAVGAPPLKMFVGFLRGALPDLKFEVQNMMAEGEWVTARWMCLPTHTRPFLGAKPSGDTLYFTALEMFRISGGKIQQIFLEMNLLQVLNQLGIAAPLNMGMPGPPGAGH
jgi:predicted ester cyclase